MQSNQPRRAPGRKGEAMIITQRTAKKWMKAGQATVERYEPDGKRLADATKWAPDETWAKATHNGREYYIVNRLDYRRVDHVMV